MICTIQYTFYQKFLRLIHDSANHDIRYYVPIEDDG